MANQIRFKRASGSDPGASDIAVGEPAVRTDTGELFFKKDDGSVAKISGGGISDGDKGDITVSNSGGTFTIDNDAVTYAKIQNVSATDRILGRDSSGAGVIEEITPANLRTMINVEDGATADQSASEIVALIADQTIAPSTIDMEDDELIKIGTSDDLQLSHNGTHSKIVNSTGTLVLQSDVFSLTNEAGNSNRITSPSSGSVRLFHSDSQKLETTSSGLDVTGNIVVSGTVDGRDLATDGSKLDGIASGATNVSTENIQDIVGGMVTGNTESGITVTYQDGDGTLDFSVASQTDENFTTTLKNKLDGIAASATNVTNNNQLTNGAGYITATLTNEQVQDIVGGMVSGNSESGITVTYQDSDGTLDFSVASQTDNNFTDSDHSKLDGIASGATANTINNNANNRVITGSGTTGTLEGESDLTFNGSQLEITDAKLRISDATPTIDLMDSSTNPDYSISNNNGVFRIRDLTNLTNPLTISSSAMTSHVDFVPSSNNNLDLGSSSLRWANLFVNDMHFANSADNPNKVDGTWGDWTLQEGEDSIYMLNNRNGKKYKMNLTEIV